MENKLWQLTLPMVAVACSSAEPTASEGTDTPDTTGSSSQALNTNPVLTDFALYAANSIDHQSLQTLGGDVGVRSEASGETLVPGFELVLGAPFKPTHVSALHDVIAPRIQLNALSTVGDVDGMLTNNGGLRLHVGPFPSTMPTLPLAAPVTAGTADLVVTTPTTLSPGSWNNVTVNPGAALILNAGVYEVANLTLRDGAHLRASGAGPVEVRIADRLSTGFLSEIEPSLFHSAESLRIEVNGTNGGTGKPTDTPPAADLGRSSKVSALLFVPNGTLDIGVGAVATGAFAARDINVRSLATTVFQDGFPVCSGSCDDGNPCTTDGCGTGGTCLHIPLTGTTCDDENVCTQTDECQDGSCVGSNPVTCTALDQCHVAGICDASSGCSNPTQPDGASCIAADGGSGLCEAGGCLSCQAGTDVTELAATQDSPNGLAEMTVSTFTPAQGTSKIVVKVTVDGQPVITETLGGIDPSGSASITVDYGAAFHGISKLSLMDDGTTISGSIDGRTLVPFAASSASDPEPIRFADGNPAPDVTVDPGTLKLVDSLADSIQAGSSTCEGIPVTLAAMPEDPPVEPGHLTSTSSLETCQSCRGGCKNDYIECYTLGNTDCTGVGVALALEVPILGIIVGPACALGVNYACDKKFTSCKDDCMEPGHGCCPKACGNGCCDSSEECLDSAATLCCSPGHTPCPGPKESCVDLTAAVCLGSGQGCEIGVPTCGSGVETTCCPSGLCDGSKCLPEPTFGLEARVTATETGPDICGDGHGFIPGALVHIEYLDIPGLGNAPGSRSYTADANGDFSFSEDNFNDFLFGGCTTEQLQGGQVTVKATDTTNGFSTSTTIPSAYFCLDAVVAPNFNGGCP